MFAGGLAHEIPRVQVSDADTAFKAVEKQLTVGCCHSQVCNVPRSSPQGCKERFEVAKTGCERWTGLASSISMDLAEFNAQDVLSVLEHRVGSLKHKLCGEPGAGDADPA